MNMVRCSSPETLSMSLSVRHRVADVGFLFVLVLNPRMHVKRPVEPALPAPASGAVFLYIHRYL